MAFEKTILLWQQSWHALTRTPIITWLGLIALQLARFYYALLTTCGFFILISYGTGIYFFKNALFLVLATLFILSFIVYLTRPTVGLKKMTYLRDFFSLENLVSTCAIIFVYALLAALMPTWFMGVIFITSLCSLSFVYEAIGSIPDKVGYALARTGYFLLYKAPVLFVIALVATVINYIDLGVTGIILKTIIFYPLYAAIITMLYVSTLHDNYELYYAE
jgi:hypothetical protein